MLIMLIMFNNSIPLTTLNVFVMILGSYFISFSLSVMVKLLSIFYLKILEGFFTGLEYLKFLVYIIIIIRNLGLLIFNSFRE